jgi:hypothetical protein
MNPKLCISFSLLFLMLEEYITVQEKIVMDRIRQTKKISTGAFYDIGSKMNSFLDTLN